VKGKQEGEEESERGEEVIGVKEGSRDVSTEAIEETEEEKEEAWVEHEVDAAEMMDDLEGAIVEAQKWDSQSSSFGAVTDVIEDSELDSVDGAEQGEAEGGGGDVHGVVEGKRVGGGDDGDGFVDEEDDDNEESNMLWTQEFRSLRPDYPVDQGGGAAKGAEGQDGGMLGRSMSAASRGKRSRLFAQVRQLRDSIETCLGSDVFPEAYAAIIDGAVLGETQQQQVARLAFVLDVDAASPLAASFQPLLRALYHLEAALEAHDQG